MGKNADLEPRNIHGRRWGRGFRPYLIVGKLLCVIGYVGALAALLAVGFGPGEPRSLAEWRSLADTAHRAYARLIVPGFLGAMGFGMMLTASMVRAMVRMRWFQLKIFLLVAGAPALHVFLRSRLASFRSLTDEGTNIPAMTSVFEQLLAGTVAGLLFGMVLLVLGRIKPRLGQMYGAGAKTA